MSTRVVTDRPARPAGRFRRLLRTAGPVGVASALVLLCYVVLTIIGPWVSPYEPTAVQVGPRMTGPSWDHLLGTDALGRDELSRIISAIRPAVIACVSATALALVLGMILGLIAGFYGGISDSIVSRIVDFIFSIPEYLLAILVLAIMGAGLMNAAIAIGIVYVPRFARTVRSATQEVMTQNYISAARLSGRGQGWIMARHVLPNVTSPLVVLAAINLSMSEGTYASLSFLGFAVRPPKADFGNMIADSLQYIYTNSWLVVPPAAAFVLFILAVILFGDAVRNVLDPKSAK